jgi:hypothetical protein
VAANSATLHRPFLGSALAIAALCLVLPGAARPAELRASRRNPAPRAPPPAPLAQVLARTFHLYGGVEAILAVGGVRLFGAVVDGAAAPGSQPRFERLLAPPDRYRCAVTLGGLERETLVLDGPRAFRDGAEVTGLARADTIRLEAARSFLPAALARQRASLVDRGEVRRGDRRIRLVELPLHEEASVTAEIDDASGQILRAVTRVAGRRSVVSFRRLQPVEGILFPFAEDVVSENGRRTMRVERVELMPAADLHFDHQ